MAFFTQLLLLKKSFYHFGFVSNCNTDSFFSLDRQFQVFIFIILFKLQLKNVWNIKRKKVICGREMKKKIQDFETLLKNIEPTNK